MSERLRIGQIVTEGRLAYIGTYRGHERLTQTQFEAVSIRDRVYRRQYVGLLRLTLGLVGVIAAATLYLVFG